MTEVTENEVQTISLNDKEYKVEDLSEKAKYLVSQVQDMQAQANQKPCSSRSDSSRYYRLYRLVAAGVGEPSSH